MRDALNVKRLAANRHRRGAQGSGAYGNYSRSAKDRSAPQFAARRSLLFNISWLQELFPVGESPFLMLGGSAAVMIKASVS
ncbi:hypothetical protein A5N82_05190 [Christensenella minuta]|uniref:Uncharacterized protein n=1 Tax=Christensenella minuta TaxID=626937 RepID=A0A136Q4U4_9FIRM|nr:hypothetical protein B1H56_12180 [Christensenella minuta]KXK65670.1 hypothetical protein HMPREF3293_01392 [Christensenella minuta]OAQ40087.1 hypothetical protein A5N82_05190 [Christensenella minuta]